MAVVFHPENMQRRSQATLDASFLHSFTGNEGKKIIREIPVDQIDPWTDAEGNQQPFRLYTAEKLKDMAENIKENGILNPCMVRPRDGRYQLIAGHNRTKAAVLAQLRTIPCMVLDVDDDTAELYMIDSNLFQREVILPSERAIAYARKLKIYRRMGHRTDLTGEEPVSAAQRVADEAGDSARNVQRYARLARLTPALLNLVDEGHIPVTVGSELANLSDEDQIRLYGVLHETGKKKISIAQAEAIKHEIAAHGAGLTAGAIKDVLAAGAEKAGKTFTVSLPTGNLTPEIRRLLRKDEALKQLLVQTIERYFESSNVGEG